MSNAIQYDPLLVRYLANELDARLRGRATAASPIFAPDLSVTLPVDRGEQLRIDLHPSRGSIRLLSSASRDGGHLDGACAAVSAPDDERLLFFEMQESGRFRSTARTLVFELHTNQWNAILLGEDGRIVTVLKARRAGRRALFPGEEYVPPEAMPRYGVGVSDRSAALAAWSRELSGVAVTERRTTLIRRFAWTGGLNAQWILDGGAGDDRSIEAAFDRWWRLNRLPDPEPRLLTSNGIAQPYPVPLEGIESRAAATLLDAMEAAATVEVAPRADARIDRAIVLVQERLTATERKIESLRLELLGAGESNKLRSIGDLLLAHLHRVPRGAAGVRLEGWDGESLDVALDPALTASENAARYYDRAGRRKRAEARVPRLLEAAEADAERWKAAATQLERGDLPEWIAATLHDRPNRTPGRDAPALPYRLYRTSGGLEVRVGRNSRDNDRLTFHASSPNDVWLHARSVPGSHVILRWSDPEASPPARDLAEAARIAAVFSRARTSGTVAVDWTRRKHVRKPRGAAPGAVIPQRVRTVFVEPDEAAVDRMEEGRV